MLALLLALGLFLAWSGIGAAFLTLARADLRATRVALSTPAVGSGLMVAIFVAASVAGAPMSTAGPVTAAILAGGAGIVLLRLRPRFALAVLPIVGIAIVNLALLGGLPMLRFGFNWIANANGDMSYYVLAATHLTGHGLMSGVDTAALAQDHGYPSTAQVLHHAGLRPGSEVSVAGISTTIGLSPRETYMPMLLALNMCLVCATAALAMRGVNTRRAGYVAAALLAISPMAAYGVLQQLMPQVWGSTLLVTVVAWLFRSELHRTRRNMLPDVAVIALCSAALFVVYVELALFLVLSYAAFMAVVIVRRRVSIRPLLLIWGLPVLAVGAVAGRYLSWELKYLEAATRFGSSQQAQTGFRLFGHARVPTAIPGVLGIRNFFAPPFAPGMSLSIAIATVVFAVFLVLAVTEARRGRAAACVVVIDVLLGVQLGINGNDFGLFKLYMYAQPFIAAFLGAWIGGRRRRTVLVGALAAFGIMGFAQVDVTRQYVRNSLNPVALPHGSDATLLPVFDRLIRTASQPVVSIADNNVLMDLEEASAGSTRRLFFIGRSLNQPSWRTERLVIHMAGHRRLLTFETNTHTAEVLEAGDCQLAVPSGTTVPFNRVTLPERGPALVTPTCAQAENLLAFVISNLGESPSHPKHWGKVAYWSLVPDPTFPSESVSAFGRYALFQVIGATPGARLALSYTTTYLSRADHSYALPPVVVYGKHPVPFDVAGDGSARVFSAPITPFVINGQQFILLDMGTKPTLQQHQRPGLTALWGALTDIDGRRLTSYVRDISLVSEESFAQMRPPVSISRFPSDLGNHALAYSGISEDGWLAADSYAVLDSRARSRVHLSVDVLPTVAPQSLRVTIGHTVVMSRRVRPGSLDIQLPLPPSGGAKSAKIALHWSTVTALNPPDSRTDAARLLVLETV